MGALLERESVLAELEHCLRSAARGAGRVVLLRGEAGVGEGAVFRHYIAGLHGERVRVLCSSCDPLATPRPLGPLIDMLAQLRGPQAAELGPRRSTEVAAEGDLRRAAGTVRRRQHLGLRWWRTCNGPMGPRWTCCGSWRGGRERCRC